MTNEKNAASRLTAHQNAYGWSVIDAYGGRWWPDDDAAGEIEAAADHAAKAVEICRAEPMRGEWHS